MSAKRLFALLVVVVLGLLLIAPTALSRPELPRYSEGELYDVDNPDDGDPNDDPNVVNGDDDNWDKVGVRGHSVAEISSAGGGAGDGAGTDGSEEELSLWEIGLRTRLLLLFGNWIIFTSLR
jgi:hypothetical protein